MRKTKNCIAFLLAVFILLSHMNFAYAISGKDEPTPRTFLVLDVSGSTSESKDVLQSLYRYLIALFDTTPYEMRLTILLFDENLLDQTSNIIDTVVNNSNKNDIKGQLEELLLDKFTKDTAVADSLSSLDKNFINKLTDQEKENCNIVVFSDMVSTIRLNSNNYRSINQIYSKWIDEKITVKSLIWNNKEFSMENGDSINKIYNIDLYNTMPAYECLFHIYFDIVTGGYPEHFDNNKENVSRKLISIWPNTYEIFIITKNNDATLSIVTDSGEKKDIETVELFPNDDFSGNPPKILKINKKQVDEIGRSFLAEGIEDFQVYSILAPQISEIKVSQNGERNLIRESKITEFVVSVDPQIKLWENKMSDITVQLFVDKLDPENNLKSESKLIDPKITGNLEKDGYFEQSFVAFTEGNGEYLISAQILDSAGNILSKETKKVFVTFSDQITPDNDGKIAVVIISVFIVLVLIGILLLIVFKKKKSKDKWNI